MSGEKVAFGKDELDKRKGHALYWDGEKLHCYVNEDGLAWHPIVLRGEAVQECPRCKQMGVLWNLGEMCDEELFSLLEKIGQEIRS